MLAASQTEVLDTESGVPQQGCVPVQARSNGGIRAESPVGRWLARAQMGALRNTKFMLLIDHDEAEI